MYTYDETTSGMYRHGIQGYKVREHIRSVDIPVTCKYHAGYKVTVETLDGREVSVETDGTGLFGDIIDRICKEVRKNV